MAGGAGRQLIAERRVRQSGLSSRIPESISSSPPRPELILASEALARPTARRSPVTSIMCGKGSDGGVWWPQGPRREARGGQRVSAERPWGGGPEERGGLWGGRPEEIEGPEGSRDLEEKGLRGERLSVGQGLPRWGFRG